MRKVIIGIGIVLLLLIVAVGIFVATFNPNSYKATIQTKLEEQLNRKIQLGDMGLGLFPPRFRVANLAIAEDPAFKSNQPFVKTGELSISVQLMPLLHKSVQVDSLTLEQPHVELIKNAQGVWNFASLGQKTSSAPSSSSEQQEFSLGKLTIDDGQVAITDLQAHKPRTVYDHVNFELTDFAPNKPFNIDASVHLPGTGNQQVQLQGTGGPLAHDNPAATPFKGALDLKDVDIAGLQKFLQTSAL
ncbi:MAG TPA: AsmA family protein, partial [Terriglobales bacterium]